MSFVSNLVVSRKYEEFRTFKRVTCADGFSVSIQASTYHYCSPRVTEDDLTFYNSFELGFPSEPEELLIPYAESPEELTETVYGYVPVSVIEAVIEKHGGIV